ncbi:hypothetical protein, partial [Polaromonas sp. YR568]|uniref:hypothetical protein n=1 Tax=Polaromonas sp. YR568 TaxID=1855301 RepID=UPI001C31CF84
FGQKNGANCAAQRKSPGVPGLKVLFLSHRFRHWQIKGFDHYQATAGGYSMVILQFRQSRGTAL